MLHAGDGDHIDGAGLMLRVRGASAAWVLRYTSPSGPHAGKRREMGLGPADTSNHEAAGASVAAAREAAHKARALLASGVDPLDEKARLRQAEQDAEVARQADEAARKAAEAVTVEREHGTLCRCARDFHERDVEPHTKSAHSAQWINSLEHHVPAALWHAPIDTITPPALLKALQAAAPHERARNVTGLGETLRRVKQRLHSVFEDAMFHDLEAHARASKKG